MGVRSHGAQALEWFIQLSSKRSGRPGAVSEETLRLTQDHLFVLAQIIASSYFPDIQEPLETARRALMKLLDERRASLVGHVVASTQKKAWRYRWYDHQVTPEFSRDPAVAGLIVPTELSKRLIRLHKEQIAAITDLVARSR